MYRMIYREHGIYKAVDMAMSRVIYTDIYRVVYTVMYRMIYKGRYIQLYTEWE